MTMNKKIDKKKMGWILIALGAVMLVLVLLLSATKTKEEKAPDNKMAQIMSDVPDAEDNVLPQSKTEAYESFESKESKVNDYWDSCEEVYEQKKQEESGAVTTKTTEELFGSTAHSSAPAQSTQPAYTNPYRETPQEREARHRRSRDEAIQLAQEISGMEQEEIKDTTGTEEDRSCRITTEKAVVKRSSIISSLNEGWDDSGISSLDCADEYFDEDEMHPFRCMFAKDSKIKNGQRVSVILQEDIVVSGTLVPKNTHIMASCKISSRLELELTNIEIGGRILALGYEAYDIDGNKGIYCPDVGSTGRQARSSGRNIISSRLSGLMGGLARDVVSTGVSLIQSKDGEMTVSVPAGYTFFIIKKKDSYR